MKAAISKQKCKKASGYDPISGKVLKELSEIGVKFLTHLFNATIIKGPIPSQWKLAQITMILKLKKNAVILSNQSAAYSFKAVRDPFP